MITGFSRNGNLQSGHEGTDIIMANPPETYNGMLDYFAEIVKKVGPQGLSPMVRTHIICLFVFLPNQKVVIVLYFL